MAIFSLLLLTIVGCKKNPPEIPVNNYVLFPIGKKSIDINKLTIEADSVIHEYAIIEDEYGGRWIKVAFNKLNLNNIVRIKLTIKSGQLVLIEQSNPIPKIWINASNYIDSHHSSIKLKANHLTSGINGVKNKTRSIQLFVWDNLELKIYKDCGIVKASETLEKIMEPV